MQVENRIRQAYNELPKTAGGWVGLRALRERVGGDATRAEVDEALTRLSRIKGWRVAPVDNVKGLTRRDQEAAVHIGDAPRHMIAYKSGGDRVELLPLPEPAPEPVRTEPESPELVGWSELSTVPTVRAVQVENRIRHAYRDLAAASGSTVSLADLREYWRGWDHTRADFDEAIRRLARDRDWQAFSMGGALSDRDRAASVSADGREVHILVYQPRGQTGATPPLRPLPARGAKKATPAKAAPAPAATGAPARPAKATPAKRAIPQRPGRVSVSDSRDWTAQQHITHAEQARQRGDLAEARLHRGLADAKHRQIADEGRGVEYLRSLTDREDARRFLRSLTREQLNALAQQLGVDAGGNRDAVIARIMQALFGDE